MRKEPAQKKVASYTTNDSNDQSEKSKVISSIGEALLAQGAITANQHKEIKLESITTGQPFENIVKNKNLVTGRQLAKAKGAFYKIPYINLIDVAVSPTALNLISKPVAQNYQVVPFEYNPSEGKLCVAMADPLNLNVIQFLEKKTKAEIIPYIASPKDVEKAIVDVYEQSLTTEVKEALTKSSFKPPEKKAVDITQLDRVIRDAPVTKIVRKVLEFAMKARASDVHIEPEEEKTRVRYRIDGILHEKLVLPKQFHEAIVSRVKILSEMKIDEKRLPQDGRFTFKADNRIVDLRVSCLPTVHGEKIVMRLLKKGIGVPDLPELGLRGRALKNLEEAILRPNGIIIVVGPTGSGKTTTLYSALSRINTNKVNIITLEDPVEYEIPGVNQVQVNRGAGLTFASGLRSFLRQDPDIIMVGEIRDEETTDLAIQAALTGHLVFSTLHTRNAAGTLPRLLDLQAEPFLLSSSVTCIVGQRVCRRICVECKTSHGADEETISKLKETLGSLYKPKEGEDLTLYKGTGCAVCNNTGYRKRVGIFEVLPITEKVGRLILEKQPASTIEKQACEEGMITMKQDGFLKAIEGITTVEEVLRVAQT